MSKLTPVLLICAMMLGACDGSKKQLTGKPCPENYKPFTADLDQKALSKGKMQKIDITDLSKIPAGHLSYVSSDLVYTNKEANKNIEGPTQGYDLVVHIRETKIKKDRDSKPELEAKNICFSGFRSGLRFKFNQKIITDIFNIEPEKETPSKISQFISFFLPEKPDEVKRSIFVHERFLAFENGDKSKPTSGKTSNKIIKAPKQYIVDNYDNATVFLYKYDKTQKDASESSYNYELRGLYDDVDSQGHPVNYNFSIRYLLTE